MHLKRSCPVHWLLVPARRVTHSVTTPPHGQVLSFSLHMLCPTLHSQFIWQVRSLSLCILCTPDSSAPLSTLNEIQLNTANCDIRLPVRTCTRLCLKENERGGRDTKGKRKREREMERKRAWALFSGCIQKAIESRR